MNGVKKAWYSDQLESVGRKNVNYFQILTSLTDANTYKYTSQQNMAGVCEWKHKKSKKPWDESESASFHSLGWRQLLSFHGSEDSVVLTSWQRCEQLTFWCWADSARPKCQFVTVEIHPVSDQPLVAWGRITGLEETAAAWIQQTKMLQSYRISV